MQRFVSGATLAQAILFVAVSHLQAGLISVDMSGYLTVGADAQDATNTVQPIDMTSGVLPLSLSVTADNQNGTTAFMNGDVYELSGQSFVTFGYGLHRSELSGSLARSYGGALFQPLQNVDYQLGGTYLFGGVSDVQFVVALADVTSPMHKDLFVSDQTSLAASTGMFSPGGMDGNSTNLAFGNLSGTLAAGRWYELTLTVLLATPDPVPGRDAGAVGKGSVTLTISESNIGKPLPTSDAPEPASVALFGIGSFGLIFMRRRRSAS